MTVQEEIRIRDLETLKVISDPLRVQILERIGLASDAERSTTVKQLSEDLNIPATKLYYHIRLLEKHKLIQVVETRLVSGILEKHYQVCARRIRVDLDISQKTDKVRDEGIALTLASVRTMFDTAYKNIQESYQHPLKQGDPDGAQSAATFTTQAMMQLTTEQAEAFIDQVNKLIHTYTDINQSEGLTFGLTVLFNPNYHIVVPETNDLGSTIGSLREPGKGLENKSIHIPPQL